MITNKMRILFNKFILGSPTSQIPNPLGFPWSKTVKKHILEGKKVSHTSSRSFAIKYASVLLYFHPLSSSQSLSRLFPNLSQHSLFSLCLSLPSQILTENLSLSHSHTHKRTLALRSYHSRKQFSHSMDSAFGLI